MADYGYEFDSGRGYSGSGGYMPGAEWGDLQNMKSAVSSYNQFMAGSGGDIFSGASQALGGAFNIAGSVFQSKIIKEQGKIAQQSAEFSAKMADYNARASLIAAKETAQLFKIQGGKAIGGIRAGYSGQQVRVNKGAAQQAVTLSRQNIDQDVVTMIANARNEAFGYGLQAQQLRTQGRMAESASRFGATATLTGGIVKGLNDIGAGSMKIAKGIGTMGVG